MGDRHEEGHIAISSRFSPSSDISIDEAGHPDGEGDPQARPDEPLDRTATTFEQVRPAVGPWGIILCPDISAA